MVNFAYFRDYFYCFFVSALFDLVHDAVAIFHLCEKVHISRAIANVYRCVFYVHSFI